MLVLLLAAVGTAIAAPSLTPSGTATGPSTRVTGAALSASPVPSDAAGSPRPDPVIRIGLVGAAETVNPLTAVTRPERDLASLVFAGLVRLGPDGSWEPGLAERWTVDDDGRTWTFELREDARWHDGAPVTAADAVFTIELLKDPAASLVGAASWRDVAVTEVDERTVRFELGTPIAGFIEAARQPLLPRHLLDGVTAGELAAQPFGRRPVGAGPYRLVALDADRAVLEPADPEPVAAAPSLTADPGDPLATLPPDPVTPGDRPVDRPADLEVRFHDDTAALEAAWAAGEIDVASGLTAAAATHLADGDDARLVRYPTTTLTTVLLNQRLDHPELRDPAARRALLKAIDRPALVEAAWDGFATVADAPIPPGSPMFDPAVSRSISHDRRVAADELRAAGWTPGGGVWRAPRETEPYALELLSPTLASNPTAFEAASLITADLRRLGLTVDHAALPPDELLRERLRRARFDAAIVDVNVGLDPDLFPLLASSQTRSSGLNLGGVIDRDLDRLLVAARAPGSEADRREAYRVLQERLAAWQYLLPIAFRDEPMLVRDNVSGLSPRLIGQPGDRFHDVLAWRLAGDRGGG